MHFGTASNKRIDHIWCFVNTQIYLNFVRALDVIKQREDYKADRLDRGFQDHFKITHQPTGEESNRVMQFSYLLTTYLDIHILCLQNALGTIHI